MTNIIRLDGLARQFGAARGVDGFCLVVRAGQCRTLPGPSGYGKSPLRRSAASSSRPWAGSGWTSPTCRRTPHGEPLFQDHALCPHMSVGRKVGAACPGGARVGQWVLETFTRRKLPVSAPGAAPFNQSGEGGHPPGRSGTCGRAGHRGPWRRISR